MSKSKHKKDVGKFKSHFELEVSEKMPPDSYECEEIEYEVPVTPRVYHPDFVTEPDGKKIYWECKGKPRNLEEMKKYIYVRDCNPNIDLRFVLMDKKTLMPRSKKTTVAEWLKKNGFVYYIWPDVPKKLLQNS